MKTKPVKCRCGCSPYVKKVGGASIINCYWWTPGKKYGLTCRCGAQSERRDTVNEAIKAWNEMVRQQKIQTGGKL